MAGAAFQVGSNPTPHTNEDPRAVGLSEQHLEVPKQEPRAAVRVSAISPEAPYWKLVGGYVLKFRLPGLYRSDGIPK